MVCELTLRLLVRLRVRRSKEIPSGAGTNRVKAAKLCPKGETSSQVQSIQEVADMFHRPTSLSGC
jgi:hypothetical protein